MSTKDWTAGQIWPDKPKFNSSEKFDSCDGAREHLAELMTDRLGDLTDVFMQHHTMAPGDRARMKGLMDDLEDERDKLWDQMDQGVQDSELSIELGGANYYITKETP